MIRCNNCMSVFEREEDMPMMQLGEDYTYACPNCKTDEYLIDIDRVLLKVNLTAYVEVPTKLCGLTKEEIFEILADKIDIGELICVEGKPIGLEVH